MTTTITYDDNSNTFRGPAYIGAIEIIDGDNHLFTANSIIHESATARKLIYNKTDLRFKFYDEDLGYGIYSPSLDKFILESFDYNTGSNVLGITRDATGNIFLAGLRTSENSVWKLNSAGVLQWSYDTGDDARGIAVDGSGNVYITGDRSGDKSVWKLNSSGVLQWDYDLGEFAIGKRVIVDGSGNVYVVGYQSGPNSFWKLNSSGSLLWSKLPSSDTRGITFDSSGNIFVTGIRTLNKTLWIYQPDGALLNSYDSIPGFCVVIDADGYIYIGGESINYDGGYHNLQKLDSAGNLVWDYYTGATNYYVFGLAVDDDKNVYVATLYAADGSLHKLDVDGNQLWTKEVSNYTLDIILAA